MKGGGEWSQSVALPHTSQRAMLHEQLKQNQLDLSRLSWTELEMISAR